MANPQKPIPLQSPVVNFEPARQWLETTLPGMLPPGCEFAVVPYDTPDFVPNPADLAAVPHAVPKRQREFSAGRQAARAALQKLSRASEVRRLSGSAGAATPSLRTTGITRRGRRVPIVFEPHSKTSWIGRGTAETIPIGADRSPVWPAGVIGSITHTAGLAVAVVAHTREVTGLARTFHTSECEMFGLGIDLEASAAVKEELWKPIFTPEEILWIRRQLPEAQSVWATRFFSAKESFFKLQHPITRTWVGFQDATVAMLPASGSFTLECHLLPVLALLGQAEFQGRHASAHGFTFTSLHLNASR